MRTETVVVVGSGGRESALVEKYSQSPDVSRIIAIPGNDMMQEVSEVTVERIPVDYTDADAVTDAIVKLDEVSLVDIGPEDALEAGLADLLEQLSIPVFGPSREAARIEWDKSYARHFGVRHGLPQPKFYELNSGREGFDISKIPDGKYFVKANSLAQGKGVIEVSGPDEMMQAINRLRQENERASRKIVIEEAMVGEEFSAFAMSNGKEYRIVGFAQDHKRANDGDEGDNTGGMGAVSNPLLLNDEKLAHGVDEIFRKTFAGFARDGIKYKGVLFLGGMAVNEGGRVVPKVIEFNSRWGDPETQVLIPGSEVDLFTLNRKLAQGEDFPDDFGNDGQVRVAVAGASRGYPGDYSRVNGKEIRGFEEARNVKGVRIYGAGVEKSGDKYYANGGRLFYVVGEGNNVIEARERAYDGMSKISIAGNNLHFRTDIGWRDVERMSKTS